MENDNVTPSYTLNIGEQIAGVMVCAVAALFASKLTEKAFVLGVTKFRTR